MILEYSQLAKDVRHAYGPDSCMGKCSSESSRHMKGKANFEKFSKTGLHPRRSVRCLPLHKTHGVPASGSNCSSHRTEEKEAR